jgi:CelD/BcsL family acetyltransferase involved in cellulose biosynthesis
MIIAAEREGRVVALAPLFSDAGMIFFVGSGGSDYLDFIGDLHSLKVLHAILESAREFVSDFVGFRFYHVPENSRTGTMLKEVADGLGLSCFDEGILPAPALALAAEPELAHAALHKKSLVRHENYFRRRGTLQVHHFQDGKDILPQLEGFFEQHVARWAVTPYSSLFKDQIQRDFYEKLTRVAARTGWLRFTRLDWGGRPIAFHFGFCYRGNYLWYKPSFAIELARRSPGEALLRQLLVAAIADGASTFDFGLGDEAFKQRFATHTHSVRTWGLYPA